MEQNHVALIAAAIVLLALVLHLAMRGLQRWLRRWRGRRRQARAVRGERYAERLLERLGYAICERQAATTWTITCEGEAHEVALRADLLVERDGKRYVAEVKTGRVAPRLATAATRRQLLEYRVAYAVDGVLLVDAEAGRIMHVDFHLPDQAAAAGWRGPGWALVWPVLWAVGLGVAAGLVAGQWLARM